jgi:dipeptidyl aminopeptidase/acylaminoacyl peptidase
MMKKWSVIVVMLVALNQAWVITSVEAKMDNLPRLPGATLLVGYPPDNLMVTTGDTTLKLQSEGGDWYVTPSVSADGHLIASARITDKASAAPRSRPLLTVGIYSMMDKGWRDYTNLKILDGTVAISADGSRLACVTRSTAEVPARLQFLDVKTGAVSIGPESTEDAGDITWSPDGRHLAFDRKVARSVDGHAIPPLRAIYVLDVESGTASKLADGMSPSWSPSGEWIAFYDYSPGRDDIKKGWYAVNADRVSIVRPDGKDYKTLVTFHRDESLNVPPVWSPDSKSILLNRPRDEDKATMDIYLLDPATLGLTRKFKNTLPVFAWVAAK